MILGFAPYLLILVAVGAVGFLLSSKKLVERFVSAGALPRAVLELLPIIGVGIRVIGALLVFLGLIMLGIEQGWLDKLFLSRFGFAAAIIILGVVLFLLGQKANKS